MNEKDIIRHFINEYQDDSVDLGIGDDAAVLNPTPGHQLVVTTDSMVENRHFVRQTPAYAIAYKLMVSNLSDIAAMGAIPKWATLNITLTELDHSWLDSFSKGLFDCAKKNNVVLVGGDTTLGAQLNVSVQLFGEVPEGCALARNRARTGDLIYVTGQIGDAAAALGKLKRHNYNHSVLSQRQKEALYMPASRVEVAIALRDTIHACIDISDGLLHELEIICQQSHAGAILNLQDIPVSDDIDLLKAITAGEDYELLFTADSSKTDRIFTLAEQHQCEMSIIGSMTDNHQIKLYKNSQPVDYPECSGYDHFAHLTVAT